MDNNSQIKKVIVVFHDDTQEEITDGYRINQIDGVLSLATIEEQEKIKQMLNEENKNGRM